MLVAMCREIQQVYSNNAIVDAGLLSECRCPHTHLTLKQSDPYSCQDSSGGEVKRLNTVFFSPEKLVDDDDSTWWAGPDSGNFTLTVDLQNTYQARTLPVFTGLYGAHLLVQKSPSFEAAPNDQAKVVLKLGYLVSW